MITPVGITASDFITASLTGARSHVKVTFMGGNIVLDDDDIESSGITITSALNAETNLTIGRAVSQEVTIPILNSSKLNTLIWTVEFKLEYGIEVGNDTYWVTLGYFTGKKPNRYISSEIIDFTAYDRMQKFDVAADDWLDSLTYPMTVLQMFKSLCEWVGVGWRAGDELPNIKARSFDSAPLVERGLTCRTVLALLAEACGCYAKIDCDGYCKMVWFENHTSDYTLTGDEEFPPIEMFARSVGRQWEQLESSTWEALEDYTWADLEGMENQFRIDAVNVKQTEDDIGVTYPEGIDGNIYYIVDNPYLVTSNQTEVTNYIVPLYTRLNNIGGYVPVRLTAIGCALIEAGDIINITADGETVRMPLFCKTTVWNGALTDVLETTGSVDRETLSSSVSNKLSVGGRYHKWKNTVDELYSELYDPVTGDVSILNQTASALGLSAAGIYIVGGKYVKIESGGTFDVDATNFKIDSTNKLLKAGNWSFDSNGMHGKPDDYVFEVGESSGETASSIIHISKSTPETVVSLPYTSGMEIGVKNTQYNQEARLAFDMAINSNLNPPVHICALFTDTEQSHLGKTTKPWMYFYGRDVYARRIVYVGGTTGGYSGRVLITDENGDYIADIEETKADFRVPIYYTSLVQQSSKEIKHNIQPLLPCGDKLDRLKPVTFVYDNDTEEKTRHGLIYEDTMEVMSEICTQDESNKAINYVELIPMLLKEIQELRARVKALEEREEQ